MSGHKNESFHNKHEEFTNKAYEDEELLPDRYVLVLTNLCNLRCSFCFQDKDPRKDAMTTQDWLNLVDQLPEYSRVTLTGGEPLIFKGFNEIFSAVAEKFDCNIITNGLLLTEEKIDFLLSHPKFKVLSLSIDDIGNKARDVPEEKWAKLKEMIEYFKKKRKELNHECILDVKSVVLDDNAHDMFKMFKYFIEELGADTHAFQFLKGSPIQHADFMFDYDKILKKSHAITYKKFDVIMEQLEMVRKYNLEHKTTSFVHPKLCSLTTDVPLPDLSYINKSEYNKDEFQSCKFPWSSVHINVDGILFPCLAIDMGNVKETKLKDIIHGEKFTRFKKLIRASKSVEACNRCGWLRPVESKLGDQKGVLHG